MPVFWFCLTVLIGISFGSICELPIIIWFSASLIFLIIGVLEYRTFKHKKHPLIQNPIFKIPFAFLILGFCLGGMRYQSAIPFPSSTNVLGYVSNGPVTLTGIVKSDPEKTNNFVSAVVKSESIAVGNKNSTVEGDVSLLLPAGFDIRYGDRLKLRGDLSKTYSDAQTSGKSYLAQNKIFTKMGFPNIEMLSYGNGKRLIEFIYNFRERAHSIIFNILPFPESAILSGILLGIETEIPEFLWDSYQVSGTIHIIAISGFNISIIALLSFRFLRHLLGWKLALPTTISILLVYTLLVGANPPVVRAVIMGIVALTARQIGRRTVSLYSLFLAAGVMLLINPFLLWSVSFQLSFLATLALITVADPVNKWINSSCEKYFSEKASRFFIPVFSVLSTTFSATLVIFPILYTLDPSISTVSLLGNFLIAPLQPAIMLFGALAVFAGFFISPTLNVFGLIVWPLIAFCNQIAIRLSISNAAIIPLPKLAFWISLFLSITIVLYFSYENIRSLSQPRIDQG